MASDSVKTPHPGVYVLSGPVQTGKTTRLQGWCASQQKTAVGGVLAPVINGTRHICDAETGECRDLEHVPTDATSQRVGRFAFNEEVFLWAHSCIRASLESDRSWIILDEIGPLELRGRGLEPAVKTALQSADRHAVVLVVRDYLVAPVIAHYGLPAVERFPFA